MKDMEQEKRLTYADLLADTSIHAGYEDGLEKVRSWLGLTHPLLIGAEEVFSRPEFESRSPIDRRVLVGRFQTATPARTREAIAIADKDFPSWQDRNYTERVAIIRKAADLLDKEKFLLSALVTYECGKNRTEAVAEVFEAVDLLRHHADVFEQNAGYVVPARPEHPGDVCRSVMRPYGVFAVISPFNFPLSLATGMAGAALITGNTVLLKPTSLTPLSVLKLCQLFRKAGVPPGAVQYLTGPGREFGEIITASPDVAGIAFTGSRDAGMLLHRTFAAKQRYPKPGITEMGSKNPVIVTEHADLARAVEGIARSAFGFSGQKCSAASRVYVHEAVAGPFVAMLRDRAGGLPAGDPREKETFIGPLIDDRAAQVFAASVDLARKDGGTIVCGGSVLSGGIFTLGHYVQPTIVTGLTKRHPLARKELFVPFLIIETFSSLAEAIAEANSTDYGLTAGIFSENDEEIALFFSRIQSGVTYANRRGGATTGAWPGTQAFCGWKASGSTGKGVGGPFYLLSYLREQAQMQVR
jgi:1-pyrroline-5-carboxylate dehydrogenase